MIIRERLKCRDVSNWNGDDYWEIDSDENNTIFSFFLNSRTKPWMLENALHFHIIIYMTKILKFFFFSFLYSAE